MEDNNYFIDFDQLLRLESDSLIREFGLWLEGCKVQSIRPALVKPCYLAIRQAIYTALVTEGRRMM